MGLKTLSEGLPHRTGYILVRLILEGSTTIKALEAESLRDSRQRINTQLFTTRSTFIPLSDSVFFQRCLYSLSLLVQPAPLYISLIFPIYTLQYGMAELEDATRPASFYG